MMRLTARLIAAGLALLTSVSASSAQIHLHSLFRDGAVLQRDTPVPVRGTGSPGEELTVTIDGKIFSGKADESGRWTVMLAPHPPGGPFEMKVQGSSTVTLSNVLFGDVWLCSGQSNMELTMERVKEKYARFIDASSNHEIRQFLVQDKYSFKTRNEDYPTGEWVPVSQQSVLSFSAVALFFAHEVYRRYKVPIGLINAAVGGSPVESWMSAESIRDFPSAYDEYVRFQSDSLIRAIESADQQRSRDWLRDLNNSDQGLRSSMRWYSPELDDSTWDEITVPEFWATTFPGIVNGSAWYRRRLRLPEMYGGQSAKLWMGRIVDSDSLYVNGTFVGTTSYQYPPRRYEVPAGVLRPGDNVVAVRVISQSGKGGFVPDKPYYLIIGSDTVSLRGKWKFRQGAPMPPLPPSTFVRWKPVGLFNAMIAPLTSYPLKGVLWYQGESNTSDAVSYERLFTTLIASWRREWNQPDLPFLFVQLANFMEASAVAEESNWARLRQSQSRALSLPNTGMAVAIDLGEWNDIHPLNKSDVGKRLALAAIRIAYGDTVVLSSGPVPVSATRKGRGTIVSFDHAGTALRTSDGLRPGHFAVSEDGKTFVMAKATLSGSKVLLHQKRRMNVRVVRYAWANNPQGANLCNAQGLPASPFEISVSGD